MSLRIRLSLIVSLLFLAGMVLGLGFLVSNARSRVQEEVGSAAMLTRQLLTLMLEQDARVYSLEEQQALIEGLGGIEGARHLELRIETAGTVRASAEMPPVAQAPLWFHWLVRTQPADYILPLPGDSTSRIVLTTNPDSEIAEVWLETRNFLIVLGVVLLVLNGLLYFILGRWLAPVAAIVNGLDEVERGRFSGTVSPVSLPELKVIVEKLNHLTAVLRDSKQENDRLTRRALAMEEDERRLLARELHDELGQAISAIKAIAYLIAQRQQGMDARSAEGAERISAITATLGSRVRSMMGRLRPVVLDELGLIPALQVMIDEWNLDHPDTFCSFVADPAFAKLDEEWQIHLYRIVQEALTNVARHAAAERVDVALIHDGHCRLRILDDGVGFDPATVRSGMGLSSIRERCQALGAALLLQANAGCGALLEITFAEAGRT
ncbi:MAG TPA: histidine kinase [Hyphomicrobiales bacterium]|nr:histidine kinase [Hyphomicrobiales bacterium]